MLKKKLLKDLIQHKAQFLSIFLMCFLSMYVYSGIYAEWKGMEDITNTYYEESNLADIWLMGEVGDGGYLEEIANIDYEGRTKLNAGDNAVTDSVLDIYAVKEADISSFIVLEGEPYEPCKTGLWLDQLYASAHDLSVGDTLSLSINGNIQKEVIRGLIWQGEYVYALKDTTTMLPDHTTYGFAFMAKAAYPELDMLPYNQIVIKERLQDETMMDRLSEATKDKAIQLIERKHHMSVQTMQEEINQHRSIGFLFPIVFLLIAMLSTLNTMNKVIANQRVQIGTLKALGFTNRRLYVHYMSHILLLCITGNILGVILGPITIPNLIYTMQETMYFLPQWEGRLSVSVLLLAILSCFICLLVCYYAVHGEVKECAATIMRPKRVGIQGSQMIARTRLWKRLSFYTQWNLRDMIRNKARSSMAIIGIMGCSGLLVCSLGLQDSILHMIDWQYEDLHTYEHKLLLGELVQQEQLAQLVQEVDGSTLLEGIVTLQVDGQKNVPISILSDTRLLKLNKDASDTKLPQNGVVIAQKLADELKLSVGDEIKWQIHSIWHTSRIAMIQRFPLSQGVLMSKEYYEQFESYQPTAILTNADKVPASSFVLNVQNREDLKVSMDAMLYVMQGIIMILILAAVLLGLVVLYNFTSLSFFERTREMATLKVIGFTNQKVKKLTVAQNMQFAVLGILLGLPLGNGMLLFMADTLSEGMDLMVCISTTSYLLSIGSTLLLTYGISKWMARKASHIDMVSALKAVE